VALKLHDMVEIWEIKSWPSLYPIQLLLQYQRFLATH